MLLGMIAASTGTELVTELGDSSVIQPLVNTLELGEGMLQLVPSVLRGKCCDRFINCNVYHSETQGSSSCCSTGGPRLGLTPHYC